MTVHIVMAMALLLTPSILLAEPAKPSFDYLSGLGSLLFVLIVIFSLAWLLKMTRLVNPGQGQMNVIASLTLGSKEKIMVVEVAQEQFLLGVTAGQINLLTKLETPLTKPKGQEPAFASQIAALLGKHGK